MSFANTTTRNFFNANFVSRPASARRLVFLALLLVVTMGHVSAHAQSDLEQLEEEAITAAVAKVSPSVIRFETIGGNARVEGAVVANGPSTGVIVSEDGYVVSASFHFAHEPASILATLPDGKKTVAKIVGRDLTRKIVLLKIDSERKFAVPEVANINSIQVGQTVIAVGRVYDAKSTNVSSGIVSAKKRIWDKAIQTDAKISPANFGGPLTDLSGNVIGILVPMSPDEDSEMAGTEWYDSGIGFAVPLTDILERMDDLKSGKSLRRGLLGISLKGTDIYAEPAVVAFCSGLSPAAIAGVQPGDEIIKINDREITRQAELKHAIGGLYENDPVDIEVRRGGEVFPFSFKLAGEIDAFAPPAIGVLLDLKFELPVIAAVIKDSAAALAGLRTGDVVSSFNGTDLASDSELRLAITNSKVNATVKLEIKRADKLLPIELTIGKQSSMPMKREADSDATWEVEIKRIKSADSPNKCFALLPRNLKSDAKPALLVWIPEPGKLDKKTIEKRWLERCRDHNTIVLVPESTDTKRWQADDMAFISSAIENLGKQHPFNPNKVAVAGSKSGGTMASLFAFRNRSVVQGLALLDASVSRKVTQVATSPVEPLIVLVGSKNELDDTAKASVKMLEDANFPVHVELEKQTLSKWLNTVLDWAATVDRI